MYKYSSRFIYSGIFAVRNFASQFLQIENELAHNILLSLPSYSQTTVDSQKLGVCQAQLPDDIFESKYKNLSSVLMHSISNKKVYLEDAVVENKSMLNMQQVLNSVKKNVTRLYDDELVRILIKLRTLMPIIIDKNSQLVFSTLSKECVRRSNNWTVNQILLFSDIWYNIDVLSPVADDYYYSSVKKLFSKVDIMNAHQFTQSFFYLNLCRTYKFGELQYVIEKKLEGIIDVIGIEELGIISMGLFKSKNLITNNVLLNKFVSKLIYNKMHISSIALASLLKILRLSFTGHHLEHAGLCSTVLMELQSEVKRMNNFNLMQLASLGNRMHLYNEEISSNIFDHFCKNIQSARLKEIERFLFILLTLKIQLKNPLGISHLMELELMNPERENEIKQYYHSFLSCVYYITCMDHYNTQLISRALQLNEFHKENGTRFRHLYELDKMVEIEGPKNYEGYRLSKHFSNSIVKKCLLRMPSLTSPALSSQEKQFLEMKGFILNTLKEEFVKIAFVLPFSSTPDILFCTDKMGNLQKFPHTLFNYLPEDVKYKPESELIWHAFVLINQNYYVRNTNTLRGVIARNIRLLKKLGYNVLIVNWQMCYQRRSWQDRSNPLLNLLSSCVNNQWLLKLKINGNTS